MSLCLISRAVPAVTNFDIFLSFRTPNLLCRLRDLKSLLFGKSFSVCIYIPSSVCEFLIHFHTFSFAFSLACMLCGLLYFLFSCTFARAMYLSVY